MFNQLFNIYKKPEPFEVYSADVLWTTPHIANNMLKVHLDPMVEAASRKKDFIERSVQFVERSFQISKGIDVIDFGCGPGLYTSEFAKLGARVTGVDFSINSIAYAMEKAKENSLDIHYVHANYLTYEAEKQNDLATLIYCDYCALDPSKRSQLLQVIHDSLNEGGHLLLDVHTKFMFDGLEESHSIEYNEGGEFFTEKPHFLFTNEYQYKDRLVSLHHYSIVEEENAWDIYNWLQYYTKESIKKELVAAGFAEVKFYANVAGDPYIEESEVMAIVCTKI